MSAAADDAIAGPFGSSGASPESALDAGPPPPVTTLPIPAEPALPMPPVPVEVRSVALAVLVVLGGIFALHWAREVLVPVLLGVMLSYALTPLVDRLEGWRLPRFAAAGLVMTALVSALVWTAWTLADDAEALIETLPTAAQRIRSLTTDARGPKPGTIEKVQAAATELERAAVEAAAPASAASGALPTTAPVRSAAPRPPPREPEVQRVVVEKPRLNVRDYLWSGALGVLFFIGQLTVVVFIAFFLLAAGTTFRRKMVKLAGPRLSQKRITLQALDEIGDQIQRYLMVQALTSVLVGVLTGLAFWAIGLDQAAVWGVLAGVTNLIPYVGAVLVGGASAVVAFLQFGTLDMALLVGGASFFIHMIVGNVITPLWTGRANRMNPFVVFVTVLAFGWLWGIWGLLLGVPILVVVKTVCDRVEELKPVGELLSA